MHPVAEGRTLQDKLRDFAFDRATRSAGEVESLYRALGCLTVAIAQLHDKGFRHRDLHPGNVLLHKGEILVCDFGASLHTQYDQRSTTSTDFPPKMERYAAPEVISSLGERNKTADVFSLGAILFEIVSAIHHHERLAKSIRDGGFRYEARLDEVVSDCNPPRAGSGVLWYIGQMLERDQQRRLPPKLAAAQFYLLSVNMVEPLMCADCQEWVTESGEPQRLSRELQEKRDRYRKQGELQKRREGRQDLTELAIKRTRSF
jgi:serine/threonine protein kinase